MKGPFHSPWKSRAVNNVSVIMQGLNGSGFIVLYSAVRLDVIIMEPTFLSRVFPEELESRAAGVLTSSCAPAAGGKKP
jgi:hypothetical protein